MPEISQEVWAALMIAATALLTGIVGKVWRPMRRFVASVDVIAGRPERYEGDEEARPGLAERLDNLDKAVRGVSTEVGALRTEVDKVKNHVQNLEVEYLS